MEATIAAIFDGRAFVPSQPVSLSPGTRVRLVLGAVEPAMTVAEAERVLAGDGSPLPWPTVDEAMARARLRPTAGGEVQGP
ncbi:MAG TPA: hypothetical protein VH092_36615 [Urbifossiella sp.]|jgi:hypothetical protein|nr:hypothetical protein [Urbifossiella sp.]